MYKKKWLLVLLVGIVLVLLYLKGVRNCVLERAEVGIPSDWATIRDCSY